MIKKMIFGALALGFFAASCSNDDDTTTPITPTVTTSDLVLDFTGVDVLGDEFVYEGWIIVDGAPVSTGRFSEVGEQTFQVNTTQLDAATKFVLSIEPASETGTDLMSPAETKLLAGDFNEDGTATLWIAPVAGGDNFDDSWGKFFLRTPTDEAMGTANNMNDEFGIWFGTLETMPPAAGLGLPTLAPGWKYEGWIVVEGVGPISTGTFTAFDVMDDNATSGFGGGENDGPPVPGEDFFLNAPDGFTFPLDLKGRTVVISIEPNPDNSPTPYTLKPLVGTAGMETAPTTYDLGLNLESFPVGVATK